MRARFAMMLGVVVGCGGAVAPAAKQSAEEGPAGDVQAPPPDPGNDNPGAAAPSDPRGGPGGTSSCKISPNAADPVDAKNEPAIYWAECNAVRAARLDGSGTKTIAIGEVPSAVAIDELHAKIYWTDNGNDSIVRASYDGTDATFVYKNADQFSNPDGIAVDGAAAKIFWTESGAVKTAGLDGASPAVLYSAKFATAVATASPGTLFFTDNSTDSVSRGDYAGGAPAVLASSTDPLSNPDAIAVSATDVFWGQVGGLLRMSRVGSAPSTIVSGGFVDGVAFDEASNRVYFADNRSDTVAYVSPAGGPVTVIYTAIHQLANPRGVALHR
jgi:DNA-binding beta-propeller fold protein YncE